MSQKTRNNGRFSVELEAASWLLEQLTIESGQRVDRSRIRRALEDAASEWPGELSERWWRWIAESGGSLDQQCRVVDGTLEQLLEMARDGAHLICYSDRGSWLAFGGFQQRLLLVLEPFCEPSHRWRSFDSLRAKLESMRTGGVIRCVVVQPARTMDDQFHGDDPSPLARFWALLTPEWPDVSIVLIFALIIGLLALATPLAVEALVNTVAFGRFLQPIVVLALMLFTFLAFSAALRSLQTYVVEIIQRRLFARVVADVAYRLSRVQINAFDGRSGPELVNRFFDVVTVQKVAAQLLLDGISLALGTLIGMAVLAFYHPWLLGFDVLLLCMIALVVFVLGKGAVKTSLTESKSKYELAAWLESLASCATAFRYDGGSEFAMERTDRLTFDYLSARRRHFHVLMRQIIFALGMQAVASTLLLGLGGWLVISGQLTLGQLVAAELIVTVIVGAFAKLGKHMESFYDVLAAIDKLGVLFDLPTERGEGMLTIPKSDEGIRLNGVSFAFPKGKTILDDVSFHVASQGSLAVTGPSASGKSLLLDLLFGLRTPTSGHLTVCGVDPREFRPDVLRKSVALVRDVEVFKGTLAENTHLERPEVSPKDVHNALSLVGLLPEALGLSDGLETMLTTTGYPLSEGQQRKLMLARALAGSPDFLLIDGVLDALPDGEAQALMASLCSAKKPWALILVTGREPLANQCDQRLTLGRLVQQQAADPAKKEFESA